MIRDLDTSVFLHELFHAFLLAHHEQGMMKSVKPSYGAEWYWLTPDERKQVLRNKWRDFSTAAVTGKDDERKAESGLYYDLGTYFLEKQAFDQAIPVLQQIC